MKTKQGRRVYKKAVVVYNRQRPLEYMVVGDYKRQEVELNHLLEYAPIVTR